MPTYTQTRKGYGNLWRRAEIMPGRRGEAERAARQIMLSRGRYEAVANRIGHPEIWPLIAAIHWREATGNFAGVLHNGEQIIGTGRKTRLVPAGRGPFSTWENAAVDALTMPGKRWEAIADWPIERWLYQAEAFNGWGYVHRGVNSPYVWAATTLQQPGKYVADHVWSATEQDRQLGVAAILKAIFKLSPGCEPGAAAPPVAPVVAATTAGATLTAAAPSFVGSFDPAFIGGAVTAALVLSLPWIAGAITTKGAPTMNATKSWIDSKGIWGGVLAAAAGVVTIAAKAMGYEVSGDDVQAAIVIISSIASSVGGLLAIYGRVTATKVISK